MLLDQTREVAVDATGAEMALCNNTKTLKDSLDVVKEFTNSTGLHSYFGA